MFSLWPVAVNSAPVSCKSSIMSPSPSNQLQFSSLSVALAPPCGVPPPVPTHPPTPIVAHGTPAPAPPPRPILSCSKKRCPQSLFDAHWKRLADIFSNEHWALAVFWEWITWMKNVMKEKSRKKCYFKNKFCFLCRTMQKLKVFAKNSSLLMKCLIYYYYCIAYV